MFQFRHSFSVELVEKFDPDVSKNGSNESLKIHLFARECNKIKLY